MKIFVRQSLLFVCLMMGMIGAPGHNWSAAAAPAVAAAEVKAEIIKQDADRAQGFAYPYYLCVPESIAGVKAKKHTIVVVPNNSGQANDDLAVHEKAVQGSLAQPNSAIAQQLGVVVLMPVFPRPASAWKTYTHALDRDALTTPKPELARFDLQLAAMIDHARAKLLRQKGLKTDERVVMVGFSAAAMFVNRFSFLHPQRVKAVALGSPGGWPLAPVAVFQGQPLRYPIGTGDFQTVAKRKFDLKSLRQVPMFVFMGDIDENDSVVFRDGYESEDEALIFKLFGKTPVERWGVAQKLYRNSGLNAQFKLYANAPHTVTKAMLHDILFFLTKFV